MSRRWDLGDSRDTYWRPIAILPYISANNPLHLNPSVNSLPLPTSVSHLPPHRPPPQILGFAKDRLGGTFPNSRCGAYFTPTTPSFDLTPHRMPIKVSKFQQNVNPTTRRGPVGHPPDFRWLLLSPPFRTIFAYAEYFFPSVKLPKTKYRWD